MKNNKIYRSIGEVAKEILVNTHTLRFWEKEFKQIKPKILSGKRRYYSEKDINLLKLIYELLKNQGYTIPGAKIGVKNGRHDPLSLVPSAIALDPVRIDCTLSP